MSARPNPLAADADRVARLERELAEAVDQQAATSEVLELMGDADLALEPVFETVVRHAVRLCDADAGVVHRFDGDRYRFAHMVGGSAGLPGVRESPPDRDGSRVARRAGRAGPPRGPDPRRARGSRLPLAHRARARPGSGRSSACRCSPATVVAGVLTLWRVDGRAVRRPHRRPPDHVRRAGGDRDPERAALPGDDPLGRRAARARRDQPGRVLEPRPRRGADHDRDPRGAALRHRGRVDLRVRPGDAAVPRAHLLRHRARARRRPPGDADPSRRDVRRPCRG